MMPQTVKVWRDLIGFYSHDAGDKPAAPYKLVIIDAIEPDQYVRMPRLLAVKELDSFIVKNGEILVYDPTFEPKPSYLYYLCQNNLNMYDVLDLCKQTVIGDKIKYS
jgi:hypothetical protein